MTYGIVSDCHLHNWSAFSTLLPGGINNRLQHILDALWDAATQVKASGGTTLYIAGDLFHVRGSISPTVLNPAIDLFKKITNELAMRVVILSGNHDLESRDSNKLSSAVEALRSINGVMIASEPRPYYFGNDNVVMIPWLDKLDDLRAKIQSAADEINVKGATSDWDLIIHAPLNGVLVGLPDHGFNASELASYGFRRVFCGHYHDYKSFGSVYSIGATTHQTWSDVNTLAGHIVVDGKTVAWFESKAPKFIDYNAKWDDDQAEENCEGNYVRVKMGEATQEEIDLIRDHISGLGAAGVNIMAVPTAKTAATTRATTTGAAPTVRESINTWIKSNSSFGTDLESLCESILTEAEAIEA